MVQVRRAGTRRADNKKRLPDFDLSVANEEHLVNEETEPVERLPGEKDRQPENDEQGAPEAAMPLEGCRKGMGREQEGAP